MTLKFVPIQDSSIYDVVMKVPSIGFEFKGQIDPEKHDSMFWMTALSEDQKLYFATSKKLGIPLQNASYTYKG